MRKTVLSSVASCLFFTATAFSQDSVEQDSISDTGNTLEIYKKRKNILKLSLTSLAFRNYQFTYERVLNKTFSASISYSLIPEGNVPFKSRISSLVDDEDLDDLLDNTLVQYNSFTAEIRIYTGGYGKGFYFAHSFVVQNITLRNFPMSIRQMMVLSLKLMQMVKSRPTLLIFYWEPNLKLEIVLYWIGGCRGHTMEPAKAIYWPPLPKTFPKTNKIP